MLGELEDDLTRFRLHNAQAVVYNNFGQADRALASYAEAREAAAHLQDATPLSVLNTNIACVYLEILDQPDRAIPHLDRALAIEGAEPIARVWALQALGRAQNQLGEHELALGFARDAEGIGSATACSAASARACWSPATRCAPCTATTRRATHSSAPSRSRAARTRWTCSPTP